MRQVRRLLLGVSAATLVSLAVVLPATAMAPKGTQLPFTLSGNSLTFMCDGQAHGYILGLTCASNTPFHVEHSVTAPAATRQDANQLAKATNDYFQLSQGGSPLPISGSSTTVKKQSDGTYAVTFDTWYNFVGFAPGSTETFTFTFVDNGNIQLSEAETYDFS